MTLRALIEDINKYSNGVLKARANHTASGIIVAYPSRKIEYILYDKDSITPGIWGEIKHFKPWNQDTDDDGAPWYSIIRKADYDKIVNTLEKLNNEFINYMNYDKD